MQEIIDKLMKIKEKTALQEALINEFDVKIKTDIAGVKLLAAFGVPMKFEPVDAEQNKSIQLVLLDVGYSWCSGKSVKPARDYLYAKDGFLYESGSLWVFGKDKFTETFDEYKSVFVEVI